MDAARGFESGGVRLELVRFEVFHGFIFVCMSDDAAPLHESLGDIGAQLPAWFGPEGAAEGMVCVDRREFTVPCNWKFLMENTAETYHTPVVHKDSLGPMKSEPCPPHQGAWDAVLVPSARSIVPLPTDFEGATHPLPTFTDSTAFVNVFPSLQINCTWDCMW